MVEFLRWLFGIKAPRDVDAELRRDKAIQRGEKSIRLGERVLRELEKLERRRDGRHELR
jgi:hypothetical protein